MTPEKIPTVKGITVRFGNSTYELLRNEARHEGIPMSAFIREAALMRCMVNLARRGGPLPQHYGLEEVIEEYLQAEKADRPRRR